MNGAPARRPRLAVLLPRGETIRSFVYSGVLDRLADEVDLDVSAAVANPEIESLLVERFGPVQRLERTVERGLLGQVRDVLDMAHGRWLWSEAAKFRWVHRADGRSGVARATALARQAVAGRLAHPAGLRLLSWLERRMAAARADPRWLSHWRSVAPDLVFNASHSHDRTAAAAVVAAERLGIATAAFVFSWDNLTSQGRMFARYDHHLVWNEAIAADLRTIYPGIAGDAVHVTGTPQFDFHLDPANHWTRDEYCGRLGIDPSRPIAFYTTAMANHVPDEPALVEEIADALAGLGRDPAPVLVVRVYAKDQSGRFETLGERRPDIVFAPVPWLATYRTPLPDDTAWLVNGLRHADVGLNVASTVTLELCLLDRPVINLGYRPTPHGLDLSPYYGYDHYRPVTESGAVGIAWSRDELPGLLHEALDRPGERAPARAALVGRLLSHSSDGHAADRVAEVLARLTRRAAA